MLSLLLPLCYPYAIPMLSLCYPYAIHTLSYPILSLSYPYPYPYPLRQAPTRRSCRRDRLARVAQKSGLGARSNHGPVAELVGIEGAKTSTGVLASGLLGGDAISGLLEQNKCHSERRRAALLHSNPQRQSPFVQKMLDRLIPIRTTSDSSMPAILVLKTRKRGTAWCQITVIARNSAKKEHECS
jgi:hypothetical protein